MASTAFLLERRQVTGGPTDVDISGLKRALTSAISGEVRFDAGTRAMYANDFSIYRAVPIGVVILRDRTMSSRASRSAATTARRSCHAAAAPPRAARRPTSR